MTPTTGITSNGTAIASDTAVSNPAAAMGDNDFLKLLVAQLQYQDPMNPSDNNQFMQEQAQFATVEGINNLQKTMTSMQSSAELAQAVSLIGKKVTYQPADGSAAGTGVVSSVTSSSGSLSVNVGGIEVDPATITEVAAGPTSTSTPSTTSGTTTSGTTTSGTTTSGTTTGTTSTGTTTGTSTGGTAGA